MKNYLTFIIALSSLVLFSCKDDDTISDDETTLETQTEVPDEVTIRSLWVNDLMDEVYL